jgi:hypothetical protein
MKRILVLLFLPVLVPGVVLARDFYFRPHAGGPYGTGDGTSYENAWHIDDSASGGIDWHKFKPGDVLYVCGMHDNGYRDRRLKPASGTTIDGDCPGDQGTIFGSGRTISDFGEPDRFGIYRIPLGGNTEEQVIEDKSLRLQKAGRPPDEEWENGSFYHDYRKRILYYKPSSEPAGKHTIYTSPGHSLISLNGVRGVIVKNLRLANSDTSDGLVSVMNSDNITLDNLEIWWAGGHGIRIQSSDNGKILNSSIHDAANGIYLTSTTNANNSNRWVISRNEIYNIDQDSYYGHTDAHAIGAQGGNNNIYTHNHLHHIGGSGITLFAYSGQAQNNNRIANNIINHVKNHGNKNRVERGIEQGNTNNDIPELVYNNVVRDNKISDIEKEGIRSKSTNGAWSYINNTVNRAGTSFAWNESPNADSGFTVIGNTFLNPRHLHINQQRPQHRDHSKIIFRNNVFHPDYGYMWNGKKYNTLASWMRASGKKQNHITDRTAGE